MKTFAIKHFFKSSDTQETWLLKKNVLDFIDSKEVDNEEEYKYDLNDTMEEELRLCISLLDLETPAAEYFALRSLYYSKLNDSESALMNAMLAIQTEPRYADGYLRLADIFLHRKMYKTVINVYIRALVNLSQIDTNYPLIENMLDIEQRIWARPVDFVRLLPREIIGEIFSYLPSRMYISLMNVSRTWYDFMINWSVMWRDLDFSKKEFGPGIALKCLKHAPGRRIRSLVLGCQMIVTLRNFAINHCHNLKLLELQQCPIKSHWLKKVIQSMGQHLTELIITNCKNLKLYDILNTLELCPKLKKLTFKSDGYHELHICEDLLNSRVHKSKIEYLNIQVEYGSLFGRNATKTFQHFPQLRILALKVNTIHIKSFYDALNTCCPNLEDLSLFIGDNVQEPLSFTGEIRFPLKKIAVKSKMETDASHFCPFFSSNQLEELAVDHLKGFKNAITARTLSRLRTLYMAQLCDLRDRDVARIVSACTYLETLRMGSGMDVTDHLMDSFPIRNQINTIDISYCRRITSVGLIELIKSQGGSLEKLIIRRCEYIHKDTINWAIQQLGKHVVVY